MYPFGTRRKYQSEIFLALDPTQIGARLKSLRGNATQQEFASMLGVGRVSIARYETGARVPDAEFLLALALRLDVDPIWLLSGHGAEPEQQDVLTDDERDLLRLFRAAPLAVKAAAIGALSATPAAQKGSVHVTAHGGHAAGRDMTINSPREAIRGKKKDREP